MVLRAAGGPAAIERRVGASAAGLRRGTGAEAGPPGGVPPRREPADELRRVKRRRGRRALANFENLPVTTHVYELSAEERACPCCGVERKEIGAEESWQIEYLPGHFERIQHVRKKYACAHCEAAGEAPQIAGGGAGRRRRSSAAWRGRGCWLTS